MSYIPPGFAEVSHKMTNSLNGKQYANVFGIRIEAADDETLANDLNTAFQEELVGVIPNHFPSVQTTVRIGTSEPSAPIVLESDALAVAGYSSSSAPANVSVLVRKVTALGGRRNRGRMYLPTPSSTAVNESGQLVTATLAAYQTSINNWKAAVLAITGVEAMVILHNAPGFDPQDITSLTVQQLVATQRRRLR